MKNILYIVLSLAIVAGLHYSGVLNGTSITHPVWRDNATLYGSLGGAVLSAGLFWICAAKPRLGRWLEWLVMLGLVAAVAITLLNARAFIRAEDFDPVAIDLWHKGSYAVFALLVPGLAALLAKLRIIGKGGRG
jgi:hypothetical protein